jgi:hypothetical protein
LDHVLARLIWKALFSLENDNTPAIDRAWLVESLANHVPSTIARLNSGLFTALTVPQNWRRDDTGLDFKGPFAFR